MKLINDVLDFSKIEEGDLKIEPSPFDLRGFLENLKSTYSPMAGKKNLDFVLSFTPEVPTMLVGDARRLSQILSNFLDNAIKFTEKGGVALRIDRESSNEQSTLCFEIEDTGIGMTQDQIGQLFQPFTQIDGSSTRMYGGTGLGLSLTKRLVEMMGGTISVESEKGIGSTFSFTAVFETVSKDMSAELEDADAGGVEAPETPSRTAEVEADTTEHLDVSIMAPKLAELSDLIRDDDTRAIRKFGEIKDYLNIPAIRGDVTILERALREYDFEDALAALSRIMDQMGMNE
jgi:two-component system sensor histidine kinase/response regulator